MIKSRYMCLSVLLCILTVDTLEPDRLHTRNQYEQEVQHWPFIFPERDQWPNYRIKGYTANAYLWENFVL
jgi:hypothetical protein